MARRPGRRRDSALRDALIVHRERFAHRWDTASAHERASRARAGVEVQTTASELFSALFPVDDAAAAEFVAHAGPDRRYVLTEENELIELPERRSDSSLHASTPGRRGGNHPIKSER